MADAPEMEEAEVSAQDEGSACVVGEVHLGLLSNDLELRVRCLGAGELELSSRQDIRVPPHMHMKLNA